jgi:peptidoglycan glycosyltransferase
VNKPIRTMSLFCMALFLALMVNATYLQYVKAGDLDKDSRNRRVIQAAFSRERGAILVGREPVAVSRPSDDVYKYQRTYTEPFKYAPVTGYFSYYSQTGIEQSENEILSGDDSRLFVTRLLDMLSNAEPKGGSVALTLDRGAQDAAYDGLQALGSDVEGAVVALEPSTGKILAMVSSPTFDPNLLADHDLTKVGKAYDRLNGDKTEPLLNRGIQTTLPPGSTFKLVTAAAAIESGQYDSSSLVPGGYTFDLPDSSDTIGNEGGSNCGGDRITLTQALDVSCNVTFLNLANDLGSERLRKQAEAFGFNQEYLDDLPLQAISRYPSDMDRPQTAMSGIGQASVTASPLQMAMVAAGIANNGVVMKPYLVDEVRAPDLSSLGVTNPSELSRAISPRTASELTQMMVSVVNEGTGVNAQIPGIDVAGKTGTAQSTAERPPYAWFVSFAPADNPQVAVAVLVASSDTNRDEIAGGRLCAPIAKAVMEAVLNQ